MKRIAITAGASVVLVLAWLGYRQFPRGNAGPDRPVAGTPAAQVTPVPADRAGRNEGPDAIAGDWELLVEGMGLQMDYTLRIAGGPGGLSAVMVSPRSGDHPFRQVAWEGGVLRMTIVREALGMQATLHFEGTLAGGELSGKVTAEGREETGTWTARRKK